MVAFFTKWTHADPGNHTRCNSPDSTYAKTLAKNDWLRLKRALAIIQISGQKVSSFSSKVTAENNYDFRFVCLFAPRHELASQIGSRCESIVERGLVEETIHLTSEGLLPDMASAKGLGYREAIEYINEHWLGKRWSSKQSRRRAFLRFILTFQTSTRQFAKRQMTWFQKEPSMRWISRDVDSNLDDIAQEIIQSYEKDQFITVPAPVEHYVPNLVRPDEGSFEDLFEKYNNFEAIDKKLLDIRTAILKVNPDMVFQEKEPEEPEEDTRKGGKGGVIKGSLKTSARRKFSVRRE